MSIADAYGFSDENKSLSSFVNLVKMIQGFDETEPDFSWANYLMCVSMMPGAGVKPGHPLHLPLDFPADGAPEPLSEETADSLRHRFAILLDLRNQLETAITNSGEPDIAVVNDIGPQAMTAIRGLGTDLEVHRFISGEKYVLGLKMRQAISFEETCNAQLIQIVDDIEELRESDYPNAGSLSVVADRLVYRLSHDPPQSAFTPSRNKGWDEIRCRIEETFTELFPGIHAVIELRDGDAATLIRGQVVGPTYQEVKQKREEMKAKWK